MVVTERSGSVMIQMRVPSRSSQTEKMRVPSRTARRLASGGWSRLLGTFGFKTLWTS
jgi:hypothetical protein